MLSVGGLLTAALLVAAAQPAQPQTANPADVPLAPLQDGPDLVPLVPPFAEYTLSLRDGDWRVRVNLRPGEPQPSEVVELRFDIGLEQGALPDAQSCLECHVKFRDAWVADLSKWPRVKR